ncbi:GNAT family N-acetyltransferase [Vitreimonas flagellata]|uniref:GNAT family N-acetyltransferase n=1 Tax=Vitreimonas flagellata TaxID=2560861 RepID=UPI001075212B|nr:N-acetyltransferase [Vitreimonas flagellata]
MSDVKYRDADAADAEALAAFAERTFTETFGHLYPPEDLTSYVEAKYRARVVAGEIAEPETRYRLALRGDSIIGYCKVGVVDMEVDATDALELHRLYVDSSAKGAGVAQALMDEALAWARGKGAKRMYLSVWENNTRAQAFYRRYGFEHVGEHKFMVGRVADRDFIWRLTL